eukprot:CAMPEP_0168551380 /NCGR_PEP_ID=MMETSP0413-20121227/6141_1 /TAXON_ID=136452 /ORGANISM="Filamoeba nolandi, Strain NC-AS-23-1" /LENGTH=68 /DNA_ID=CAMNT_0008581901 /DNA_START=35 /DNA_END=241 /DNA_ORIENTATION=-
MPQFTEEKKTRFLRLCGLIGLLLLILGIILAYTGCTGDCSGSDNLPGYAIAIELIGVGIVILVRVLVV